jgi:catechol 2,3-dioxygenase-like lactoylglutathione lyase family enzyme
MMGQVLLPKEVRMKLQRLDHVNIHTKDSERLAAWYQEHLELKNGKRPKSDTKGNWLYLEEHAIIHLVQTKKAERPEDPALEHFALAGTGLGAFLVKLDHNGIPYDLTDFADAGVVQVNLRDCDGNHLHIDFPISEKP